MKNKVEWLDIVKVNGGYYLERFDVEFEDKRLNRYKLGNDMNSIEEKLEQIEENLDDFDWDCLYNCDNFFESVREKYNLTEDDEIKTYMFDDIELPEESEFDIAWCGGYINGVNF